MARSDDAALREEAVREAIRLAERRALPVRARSRTHAELIAGERRAMIILAAIYVVMMGALLAAVAADGGTAARGALTIAVPIAVAGGLLLYWVARRRIGRHAGYRDPELEIEVDGDGVTMRRAGETRRYGWSEVEAAIRLNHRDERGWFAGLELRSPYGPVPVEDTWFSDGRAVATAIVAGMNAARLRDEQARIERAG